MAREVRLRRAGDCGGGGNGTQHPAPYPPHPCHTLTLGCLWPGPAQPAHPNLFISGLIVTMSISAAHLTPHNILCCVLNTCITILHREWWLDVWCLATQICRYVDKARYLLVWPCLQVLELEQYAAPSPLSGPAADTSTPAKYVVCDICDAAS